VPLDEFLAGGARVMWCAAHPDDECFPGGILARASLYHGDPVHFLVLTHGDGGECGLKRGCAPDLATVRGRELAEAVRLYRATLQHERFWNAPLPVSSFPARQEIYRRWCAQGDPVGLTAAAIRRFAPDLLLTFDPDRGATGHPEHQLASRIATAAVRQAADPGAALGGLPPHRVARVYYLLNRFWVFRMLGIADPGPVTEVFDATLPCSYRTRCVDFMAMATRAHRTQQNDMGNVREHRSLFEQISLRQVDPFTEIKDPAEPV
jgi:LmbE family N-acetylglucosaminyl deacetylase